MNDSVASKRLVVVLPLVLILSSCGQYPLVLETPSDIAKMPSTTQTIKIGKLPLDSYRDLEKFTNVMSVDFFVASKSFVSDSHLKELARLPWQNLTEVCVLGCTGVTDVGISHLVEMPSVRGLQLEGTSISDKSMELIAARLTNLVGINVANCPGVTVRGLEALTNRYGIKEIGFSASGLTQKQVVSILRNLRGLEYCILVDPQHKISRQLMKDMEIRGVTLVIKETGALQDVSAVVK